MNLTKAQLQAIGHLTNAQSDGSEAYMVRREKVTRVSQPFVSGVITFDADGKEVGIAPINSRVIDALHKRGLIESVASDSVHGSLFKPTLGLLSNEKLIEKSQGSFGERATQQSLQESALKFGCSVQFDTIPRLFKVVRLDGKRFTKPHIDVSSTGVKVVRLTDLTIEEWEHEISLAIQRSELI